MLPGGFHSPMLRRKDKDEPWRALVARYARPHGVDVMQEALADYDRALQAGETEYRAAWSALHDNNALEAPRK